MPFSIDEFRARGLVEGGARPNLFRVTCIFPALVGVDANLQGGQFLINAAQLPAGQIEEVRVFYFGRPIKLKGDRVFQDWDVRVMNDEDFALRNAFESWQNSMNYLEGNFMDPAFANQGYKTNLLVEQFAKDGPPSEAGVVRSYTMVGAWPTTVSPINLDWGDVNRVEEFSVTFAYDYWIPGGTSLAMEAGFGF